MYISSTLVCLRVALAGGRSQPHFETRTPGVTEVKLTTKRRIRTEAETGRSKWRLQEPGLHVRDTCISFYLQVDSFSCLLSRHSRALWNVADSVHNRNLAEPGILTEG